MRTPTAHSFRRRPPGRWLPGLLLALLCLAWPVGRAEEPTVSEPEFKAIWLLNFIRYTDWPDGTFPSPREPFVVVVAGRDAFGGVLEKTFSGKTVRGRSVEVKRWTAEQTPQPCHLLYVTASEGRRQRDWLARVRGQPVLTVGETSDFLASGGMLQFVLKDGTVRFSAGLPPAQRAGLHLHASLLKVALSVHGRYE